MAGDKAMEVWVVLASPLRGDGLLPLDSILAAASSMEGMGEAFWRGRARPGQRARGAQRQPAHPPGPHIPRRYDALPGQRGPRAHAGRARAGLGPLAGGHRQPAGGAGVLGPRPTGPSAGTPGGPARYRFRDRPGSWPDRNCGGDPPAVVGGLVAGSAGRRASQDYPGADGIAGGGPGLGSRLVWLPAAVLGRQPSSRVLAATTRQPHQFLKVSTCQPWARAQTAMSSGAGLGMSIMNPGFTRRSCSATISEQ